MTFSPLLLTYSPESDIIMANYLGTAKVFQVADAEYQIAVWCGEDPAVVRGMLLRLACTSDMPN